MDDSLIIALPSMIIPSAAIRSPLLTNRISPILNSLAAISFDMSFSMIVTRLGTLSSSDAMAPRVFLSVRFSR
jgi:hypothetical protein